MLRETEKPSSLLTIYGRLKVRERKVRPFSIKDVWREQNLIYIKIYTVIDTRHLHGRMVYSEVLQIGQRVEGASKLSFNTETNLGPLFANLFVAQKI